MTTRFSDARLIELEKRVETLCEEFDTHIKEQKSYRDDIDMLLGKLIQEIQSNNDAVARLAEKSEGAISLFNDMAAGGRILVTLGKISAALLKVGAIVATALGINHILNR